MFKRILLPTDGSPLSEEAIVAGVAFAKELGARVSAVTISEPVFLSYYDAALYDMVSQDELGAWAEEAAKKALDFASQRAAAAGVPYDGVYLPNQEPYLGIIETAERAKCDLIFMASHGRRGLSSLLLGSVTRKVLTHSKTPVLVFRK